MVRPVFFECLTPSPTSPSMSGQNSVKCTNKSKPGCLLMHLLRQRAQNFQQHFLGASLQTRLCLHTQQCHKGTLQSILSVSSYFFTCLKRKAFQSITGWDCTQRHCNTQRPNGHRPYNCTHCPTWPFNHRNQSPLTHTLENLRSRLATQYIAVSAWNMLLPNQPCRCSVHK